MQIELVHLDGGRYPDGSWQEKTTIEKQWNLTARGLAAAFRALDSERDWVRRNFGPGTISPVHKYRIRVTDGETAHYISEECAYRPYADDHYAPRNWAAAAYSVERDFASNVLDDGLPREHPWPEPE